MIERIDTENAPAAIGPYSQAIGTGRLLFVSGQIPINPATNAMVKAEIHRQTEQVLDNLESVLLAAGCTTDSVVKVEIFIRNMNDFAVVNELYTQRFSGTIKPARQVVEVSGLPKDALIEMSCIAVRS